MGIVHVNVVLIGRLRWAWWFAICVRPSGRVAQPANGVQQPTNTRGPPPSLEHLCLCSLWCDHSCLALSRCGHLW